MRERAAALENTFAPHTTVRCDGEAAFRTKAARDAASLIEMDRTVLSWSCLPKLISWQDVRHALDFSIKRLDGLAYVDVAPIAGKAPPSWMSEAGSAQRWRYEVMIESSFFDSCRLTNSQKMLQYAAYDVSLRNRVRVLSFLEEHGPASLATCMTVIRDDRRPFAVLAALAVRRVIEIGIDEALGPHAIVSCFQA